MSTSRMSVACSFETLKCYHILQLFVNDEDGNAIFQPTLIEEEVFRLLRGLKVLPKVDTNETNIKPQAELVGQYINGVGQTSQLMEVVAYFGKQSMVEKQLKMDGLWPEFLHKYIDSKDEGVYAITPSIVESNRRIVVFAWLSDTSFGLDRLRERATYVLRFLTSLTSHVVYCLTLDDFNFGHLTTNLLSDSLTSKKYSMSFSIATAKVIEEKVECIVDKTYNWYSRYGNSRLIPGSNRWLCTMKLDRSTQMTRNTLKFRKGDGFANWFNTLSLTHNIEINCMIPEPWMIQLLESKNAYPHDYIDSITPETMEFSMYHDVMNEIHAKLIEFATGYKEWAKYSFYLVPMTYGLEIQAKSEMDECIGKLKEWRRLYSGDMALFLIDFPGILNGMIQESYRRHPLYQPTTSMWGYFKYDTTIPFPYLKFENRVMIHEILNVLQHQFCSMYGQWCKLLDKVCNDSSLLTKITNEELNKRLKSIKGAELAKTRKEEAIRDAFSTLVRTMNYSNQHSLRANLQKFPKGTGVSCSQESYEDKAMIVTMYEWTNDTPMIRCYFNLPAQAKVMYMTRVVDLSIVVYTEESYRHISTTIHVYKKATKSPHFTKYFPHEALLVDFDCSHRLLGILHSNDVDFYTFHESYKGLERVGAVKLVILRVSSPYTRMLLFGGDNHGMTLIDEKGYLQSYFIRSKQVSKLEIDLLTIDNTKVVKIYGGDLLLFLTMEEDDRMSKEYTVVVKCMATADNSMLPMTKIIIPNTITWMNCMFESYEDQLVCFDPVSSVARTWTMHIVTGKTAWQLKRSHVARGMDNGLESHPLWCLFHLFEKFPVQSLIAKTSKEDASLVSGQLFLHVLGSMHKPGVVAVLDLVMKKLASLNKCITPLIWCTI